MVTRENIHNLKARWPEPHIPNVLKNSSDKQTYYWR